ncbi:hypothetical protein D3C77_479070 [compost metagenome]
MRITIEKIESLQESVKNLPAVENKKREVTKPEAVKMLASQVAELQGKGYTLEMIAEIFTNHGLEIKPQTLKSYLTRARNPKATKKRIQKPAPKPTVKPAVGDGKESSRDANQKQVPEPSVVDSTGHSGKGTVTVPGSSKEPVKSGTFQPRGDSREI